MLWLLIFLQLTITGEAVKGLVIIFVSTNRGWCSSVTYQVSVGFMVKRTGEVIWHQVFFALQGDIHSLYHHGLISILASQGDT